MGVKRAMVIFDGTSGLPADRVVNTFHFGPGGVELDIFTALLDFYNGGTTSVASFLSGYLSRTANKSEVRVYDLADAKPREPTVFNWTLGATTSGSPLAREIACCMSYYADRNVKRQRGRIYLGPLTSTAVENRTGDQGFTTAFRAAVGAAATRLAANPTPADQWIVYSEVNALSGGMEYGGLPVTAGWVDDAIDIQRRRGVKATARSEWT